VSQHPEWRFKECQDSGKVSPVDLKGFNSGKTESYLIENGAFYFVNGDWLVKEQSLYNFANHGFYLMSIADSIDIDTEEDWQMAEAMLRYRQS
jgi:CMP-N-acetylneuraminic acid synthetase